jgi:hypothetical protein
MNRKSLLFPPVLIFILALGTSPTGANASVLEIDNQTISGKPIIEGTNLSDFVIEEVTIYGNSFLTFKVKVLNEGEAGFGSIVIRFNDSERIPTFFLKQNESDTFQFYLSNFGSSPEIFFATYSRHANSSPNCVMVGIHENDVLEKIC